MQHEASTYNYPCGDLFNERSREDDLDFAVPLYRASMEGDLEAAKLILDVNPDLVRYSINENMETPLHVAAGGHSLMFVRFLMSIMTKADMELQNKDGNTAFCLAVILGNVSVAKYMLDKNRALLQICGSGYMKPLSLAAFHGFHDMVTFLYNESDRMKGDDWTDDDRSGVLFNCVRAGLFDVALRILEENEILPLDKHIWDVLWVLAQKPGAFVVIRRRIYWMIIQILNRPALFNESIATLLLKLLWKRIMKKPKKDIDAILRGPKNHTMGTYSSQILFVAAKLNNRRFLVELISEYPSLIWKRNDDGQTLFHIAVAHRHRGMYSLLLNQIGSKKDQITPIADKEGNNILHLVGKRPENIDHVPSSFLMHTEILWYKEVESLLPTPFREVKNVDGYTPHELFTQSHRQLLSDTIKGIHDTINLSMVVSALVCTIGFTVVFSVPGGFDQTDGFPIFLRSSYFFGFIAMVAISFLLSSISILLFLSIIVPGLAQVDTEMLLKKWVIGHAALLSSVIAIISAFVSSLFILYRNLYKTSVYVFYAGAIILMYVYISMHYSLYRDLLLSIFIPRYLFRQPMKNNLFRLKKMF